MRFHDMTVAFVALDQIEQHPDNANNGDLDALEQSIDVNGFYAPILVQRSTGYILAGNHRYMVAHKQHAPQVPVIYLDVNSEEAKRIMLADNRTTRLGVDDEAQLYELLDSLHDTDLGLMGTGYSNGDLQYLINLADEPLTFEDEPAAKPSSDPEATAPKPEGHRLGFSIMPTLSDDGRAYELVLTKPGLTAFSRHDLNRLRKALGQNPVTDEEWDAYGVSNW